MDVNSMTPDEIRKHAYTYVEEGNEQVARRFYDFCWEHFRGQMRVMITSFVEGEEKDAFTEYLAQDEEEA